MAKFKTSRQIASDVRAMISYDVNQGDIAKQLHVSRAYLSEFLSGKREVSAAILEALGYESEPLYRIKPTRSRPMTGGAEGYGSRGAASIPARSVGKKFPDEVEERSTAFGSPGSMTTLMPGRSKLDKRAMLKALKAIDKMETDLKDAGKEIGRKAR